MSYPERGIQGGISALEQKNWAAFAVQSGLGIIYRLSEFGYEYFQVGGRISNALALLTACVRLLTASLP